MTPASVVQGAAGLGKTTEVLKAISKGTGTKEIYVPTHALASEVGERLRALNTELKVKVVAGRSHVGPDGNRLCKKHQAAEEIARVGGDVYGSLCALKNGGREQRCRHYQTCPYINQFTPSQVRIYPHAYLPLQRTRLEGDVPDTAVIDESFFMSCIEILSIQVSLMRAAFLGPLSLRLCKAIEEALTQCQPLFSYLWSVGITLEECRGARNELRRAVPKMSPTMGRQEQRKALRTLKPIMQVAKLLAVVLREGHVGRAESHGITYCADKQLITVHIKRAITRFQDEQQNQARVLVMDANADEKLIGQFFDIDTFHRIEAVRQAKVIQCRSTRCSKTSLVPKRNSDPRSKRAARKRLRELEAFISDIASKHKRVLVVGPQEITGNGRIKLKPLVKVPSNVDLAHFGAIRGIDRWKDHDALILVGRNEPAIEALEAIARCVFLTDREPLGFSETWSVEDRGYRLRNGELGVGVVRHQDARVQAVLEQVREGESQQAIDRLRLVHTTTMKQIYILSNVVLDIDVDELVTWEELMNGGRRIQQAWNRLQGVIPLKPAWLAKRFPELWRTADAAKADARRALKEGQISNSSTISSSTLFRHQYRPVVAGRARQRAWSVCLSRDANPQSTRVNLEVLLGSAVEMRSAETRARPTRIRQSRRPEHKALGSKPEVLSTPLEARVP